MKQAASFLWKCQQRDPTLLHFQTKKATTGEFLQQFVNMWKNLKMSPAQQKNQYFFCSRLLIQDS